MTKKIVDVLGRPRTVLSDAFAAFRKNNDLSAASSLAFSATIALIPALFLLTFVLGAAIGSSERALVKTQELLTQVIPAFSQDILREVRNISSHRGTIGLLNVLVLLWSVTPLVADMRVLLGTVFRKKPTRTFLIEKLLDVAISIVILLGLSAIAIAGIVFSLARDKSNIPLPLPPLEGAGQVLFVTATVFSLYFMFSKRAPLLHLLIGAFTAALLWFVMRPAFHLFLIYNPGYGFAFGSFKSLFVVIIWIYFSLVVFLFGAEVAASLARGETSYIKRLMELKRSIPSRVIDKYVVVFEKESVIFNEGEPGDKMFSVYSGRVAIRKGGRELAVIEPGKWFGGMSFLLGTPRVASAVALEDVELVTVSNENINGLMNEYPDFFMEMLREMAQRLRETSEVAD